MDKIPYQHFFSYYLRCGFDRDYNWKLLIYSDNDMKLELCWYGYKTIDNWKSIKYFKRKYKEKEKKERK